MIYIFGGVLLILLSIYSYALIDPNLTLINHPLWVKFRDPLVEFGFSNRHASGKVYVALITGLFLFHYLVMRRFKEFDSIKLSLGIAGILLFSYPFLSHDFFNYLFDAKIVTFYHQNPYLHTPLEFPGDEWLRFMHWVHRRYPYGSIFLIISIIPSFLSLSKFVLTYLFFKLTFISFYLLAVYYLHKFNQKVALQFATHPLVLVEGLIVLHNDLIAVCLAMIGLIYLLHKKVNRAQIFILLSVGIKYFTLPYLLPTFSKDKRLWVLAFLFQISCIFYFRFTGEWQPWYFLNLLGFLPVFSKFLHRLQILFAGLLFSYYPYVALGGWEKQEYVDLKNQIILFALGLNIIFLIFFYLREYRKGSFLPGVFLFSKEHI
jgi:hypothetical protein